MLTAPTHLRKSGQPPRERFVESVACEGEIKQNPEVSDVNLGKDTEGGTASADRKGEPTNPGYLTFDPGGMSKTNYGTLYQESKSNEAFRGETNKIKKKVLEIPQKT